MFVSTLRAAVSRTHGDTYYVNVLTGHSQYERPTEPAPAENEPSFEGERDTFREGEDRWEESKQALAAAEAAAQAEHQREIAEKRGLFAPYGTTPRPRVLPEGWVEQEATPAQVAEGIECVYRNTENDGVQTEFPAFGLTAKAAVKLGIGGLGIVGGRGRVMPPAAQDAPPVGPENGAAPVSGSHAGAGLAPNGDAAGASAVGPDQTDAPRVDAQATWAAEAQASWEGEQAEGGPAS